MTDKDPWMLDSKEHETLQSESKGASKGVFCPKKNPSIGGECAICEMVSIWFNTNDKADEVIARQKMAKQNFYMNVVFPHNPDKVIILEVGKKAGNEILDGINNGDYRDIAHPLAGMGRCLKITKKTGDQGYNTYRVNPVLDKADWEIPEEARKNSPNLDNIIALTETEDVFKISSIKLDETLEFRVCPPWDNGSGNKRTLAYTWKHWGATQEEVDGDVPVKVVDASGVSSSKAPANDKTPPWEEPKKAADTAGKPAAAGREACFGQDNYYDADDEDCKSCKDFKACGKVILKG